MQRTTMSRLPAYFGDLVALTGVAVLAVDLLGGGPTLNQQTVADLSLVGAGLLAHRVTASRLREASAIALALLLVGAAPSVLMVGRWWIAVAAATAAALAAHVLLPATNPHLDRGGDAAGALGVGRPYRRNLVGRRRRP